MVRLTFHGAAETVTGSKYLLEADGTSILIDCGLFQGLKELRLKNWDPPPFAVGQIQAIVLTHAHIDHTGYLPRLARLGYRGPIYATPPTCELTELLLYDSARTQEDDASYANRKGFSKHKPAQPLYDSHDAARAVRMLKSRPRDAWHQAAGPFWYRWRDTGHLLGSCMIEVEVRQAGGTTRLLFSGDVGRYHAPLYFDPSEPPACDYLICESTYGNREHPPESVLDTLAREVLAGLERGGVLLTAAFAVGRAQQLVYLLRTLIERKQIPSLPIYIDSPMAVNATQIYRSYEEEHDLSELQLTGPAPALSGREVHLARTVGESKQINQVKRGAFIISSSGMMTGGRILHHLKQRLPQPQNTLLLGGFMAAGTRGRSIQEGADRVRIHGQDVPVRCAVREISGLSGHAGHSELLRWLEPLAAPRRVFLTHGEPEGARQMASDLASRRGWNCHVPHLGESVEL